MESRERWGSRLGFLMAAVGAAAGLGNIWRFPYLLYKNGGGAFLIPYFIALLTAGIPLVILEYYAGQRTQSGAPRAMARLVGINWEWVGWFSLVLVFLISTYYTVIMAWVVDHIWFSAKLAWEPNAETFFFEKFLQRIPPEQWHGQLGAVRFPIFIGLVIAWIAIYLSIFKGPKLTGKVATVLMITPVVILIIMVIRGLTLPNATEGLKFYLTPDFSKLKDPRVWLDAYGQIFFTLSLAMGTLMAYASYKEPDSEINNNAFITALGNSSISFLGGFAVFSILGFLAFTLGKPVGEVVRSGIGLAFVSYPTAISKLPGAPIWGILFFFMLLNLATTSAFSQIEGIVAGVRDKWKIARIPALLGISLASFLVAIIYTTKGGFYWLDIVDFFVSAFGLTLVGLLEAIAIGYFFGTKKLREDVNSISEVKIGTIWDFSVKFITPAVLIISLVLSILSLLTKGYGGYPSNTILVGLCVYLIGIGVSLLLAAAKNGDEAIPTWVVVLLVIFTLLILVSILPKVYSAVIMGLFGAVILWGGLIYFVMLAYRKRTEERA
ncbi:MAG: sodium-dependent transporter [Candidatus Hydrothermota bacterium]|nr:MAG: sodium-dependent transporter [Candidatus Hydrothermae bacterium]